MSLPFSKDKFLLTFDTETTGFGTKQHLNHPSQPHIVQLAATLTHIETREVAQSMDVIIKPDGWKISDGAAKVHGITNEIAHEVGVPEVMAIHMFHSLWEGCAFSVAHNYQFDRKIMMSGFYRFLGDTMADKFGAADSYCTQEHSTPIVKAPPTAKMIAAGRIHYKSANLGEAYKHFTGKDIVNAHSAMADVQACMAVYWGIQDSEKAAA